MGNKPATLLPTSVVAETILCMFNGTATRGKFTGKIIRGEYYSTMLDGKFVVEGKNHTQIHEGIFKNYIYEQYLADGTTTIIKPGGARLIIRSKKIIIQDKICFDGKVSFERPECITYLTYRNGKLMSPMKIYIVKTGTTITCPYFNPNRNQKYLSCINGYVKETHKDGTRFMGKYKNGERFGIGIETDPRGNERAGNWISNRFLEESDDDIIAVAEGEGDGIADREEGEGEGLTDETPTV
jgi:hypothetical protein